MTIKGYLSEHAPTSHPEPLFEEKLGFAAPLIFPKQDYLLAQSLYCNLKIFSRLRRELTFNSTISTLSSFFKGSLALLLPYCGLAIILHAVINYTYTHA